MNGTSEAVQDGFWTDGFEAGLTASWTFSGLDGLERLSGPGLYSADDPTAFEATLDRVQLDHVAIESMQSTPHRYERDRYLLGAYPTPMVALLLLVEGEVRFEDDAGAIELGMGDAIAIDTREPLRYTAPTETRTIRSLVGVEHLPPQLRDVASLHRRPIPRTRLVDTYFSFVWSILKHSAPGIELPSNQHLIQAVADLETAVLAEAIGELHVTTGVAGLRYRIEDYIERHLTDPDLDVQRIADRLGVSVRYVHRVFNDDGRTVTRFIRDRRIAAVAAELRTSDKPVHVVGLARRYGFTSADTLSRAFRQRYGASPTRFRSEGHRTFG